MNQPVSLTLVWNSVSTATGYHVQVAADTGFSTLVTEDTSLTDSTFSVSGFSNSTVYYWRVRAKNAGGTSNWTGTWSFTTIIAAPAAPGLVLPANGSTDQPITPTLQWNSAASAVSYHLQIAMDSAFSMIVMEDSTLTDTMIAISALDDSTLYYWRMQAKNAGGTGAWSEVWSFSTGTSGVLPDNPAKPLAFSISGSSSFIRYSLGSVCHVSLKYYDLRGRLVATLVNRVQGAGSYVLSIKDALPSRGTYIRVFEAGSFIKRDLTAVF